jgi:hypothetical protein
VTLAAAEKRTVRVDGVGRDVVIFAIALGAVHRSV